MYSSESMEQGCDYFSWPDLYMKGDDLQKLSVIQALPELLQTDHNATITRIIPKIQQELPNSSSEFHIVTSKMFKLLIEMKLPFNLMRPVLQGIESKDPIVCNAWIDTLLSVINILEDNVLKNEVLPFAMKMTQLNRVVFYRVGSCKILGRIAIHPKVTSFEVKKDILPLAQSLCQDCLHEVRTAMCQEIPNVAKGLNSDSVIKSSLLPCLVELSNDENMQVKSSAVDSVVLLIPYLNSETIISTIVPLVKKLCISSSKEGDQTYPAIAKAYGLLLNNVSIYLSKSDSVWFLSFFQQLSRRGLFHTNEEFEVDPGLAVMCRDFCAYNLPAVTVFTICQVSEEFDRWYSVLRDLAGDPCYIIRKTVAGCIHEVTRILGNESKRIIPDLVKLMRDDAEEVLDALVTNIGKTLDFLSSTGILSRNAIQQSTMDIGRGLLKCQVEIFKCHNWRRQMTFLEQLEYLPICMPSDFIHQHFTPVVLKLTLDARSRPVRTQAARTMLVFLRYNSKENHRRWIRDNLIGLLCNSQSCYTRHIFINMCHHAINIFSWKYFKEYFYLPLLSLGDDPVSTVRLSVTKMCPVLKQMLMLPLDRNLQMKLENFLSRIEATEKDKDVLDTLNCTLKEMRIPHVNKHQELLEERRKIEEEEKIQQGKFASEVLPPFTKTSSGRTSREIHGQNSLTVTKSTSFQMKMVGVSKSNDMSFLGQHFYIDAGVPLLENANNNSEVFVIDTIQETESKLAVLTLSVENTNIENMSDDDLKELETSTTNITDDVKANIRKFNQSKAKNPSDGIKRRNKRSSWIYSPDHTPQNNNNVLKRRSLNIGPGEISRIPICFKPKLAMKKSKSENTQNVLNRSSFEKDDGVTVGNTQKNVEENNKSQISNKNSSFKTSHLPVLIKNSSTEPRK